MRWIRLLALLVIACACGLLTVFVSPVLYPHFLHMTVPLWIQHLRHMLLPGGTDVINQPYTWALFASVISLFLLASLSIRLRKDNPYGSARPITRRESRRFRVSRGPSRLLHPLLAALRVIWMLDTTWIHRHLQRRERESWFITGRFGGRLIGLDEHDQEEHLLLVGPTGSRKSTLEIIGNLLRERGNRSLFIPDLKK